MLPVVTLGAVAISWGEVLTSLLCGAASAAGTIGVSIAAHKMFSSSTNDKTAAKDLTKEVMKSDGVAAFNDAISDSLRQILSEALNDSVQPTVKTRRARAKA